MKKLKYKYYKGLQTVCTACSKAIHKNQKPYTDKKGRTCYHPFEKHKYKAVLYDKNTGKRITRNLNSTDYDEAIKELDDTVSHLDKIGPLQLGHYNGQSLIKWRDVLSQKNISST